MPFIPSCIVRRIIFLKCSLIYIFCFYSKTYIDFFHIVYRTKVIHVQSSTKLHTLLLSLCISPWYSLPAPSIQHSLPTSFPLFYAIAYLSLSSVVLINAWLLINDNTNCLYFYTDLSLYYAC